MLAGLRAYLQAGRKLQPPAKVQAAIKAYRAEMDTAGRWITLVCEQVIGEKLTLKVIHEAYARWYANEIGTMGAISNQKLASELRKHGYESAAGHAGVTFFQNIRLKVDASGLATAPGLSIQGPEDCDMSDW